MKPLKQSTASQTRVIGGFVDDTDFKTPETGLTIANTDIKLSKNGAAAVNKNSGGATALVNGMYAITLDATDTDTVGELEISVKVAGALLVWEKFFVLEEAVYDAFYASGATNLVSADIVSISGDTTSADNLELMYDGTGYVDDTAPASREQVGNLGGGASGGFNYAVSADNTAGAIIDGVTFVGSQTGTFANTAANPATFHQITHSGNGIDLVYRIPVGEVNQATSIDIQAYLNSNNDVLNIQLYDHIGADWETQFIVDGKNGSSIDDYQVKPLAKHTGGIGTSEAGNVYVRFVTTGQTSPVLFVATCIAEAVASESTMGYEAGLVYCDEAGGTSSGVVQGTDGIFANQSDDFDNAQTIADGLGSGLIAIAHGNDVTLTASLEGYTIFGNGGIMQLGGQNIGSTIFREFGEVSGIAGTSGNPAFFEDCLFTTVTIPPGVIQQCGCDGSLTMVSAGDYTFVDCYSIVAGSASPVFTKTPGQAITAEWRRFSGGVTLSNIETGDIMTISGELGTVTLNGANGTVEIRGIYKAIVDNRTGSPTLNTDGAIQGVDVATTLANIGTPSDFGSGDATISANLEDMSDNGTAAYDRSTDSLQAIRDRGDAAWITGNTTAPDNAGIAAIKAVTDVIPDSGAMTSIAQESTLTTVDANVDAVKAKTDNLTFTSGTDLDTNVQKVNDVTVTGTGASGDEWGP